MHKPWWMIFFIMLNWVVTKCFMGTLFVDIDNCPIPLTKLSFVVVPKALLLNPPSPRKPFEPRGPLLTAELNAGSDELLWNELALLLPTLKFLSVAVIVLNKKEYMVYIQLCTAISRKVVGKMCTQQSQKVIWDMINTLFLMTVPVEPTFAAFL